MKCAFAHLSDIHFRASANLLLERADLVANALWSQAVGTSRQYLIVTGDVAFSGKSTEYEVAEAFIRRVVCAAAKHIPEPSLHVIAIPGNHDCNFAGDNDLRNTLLATDPCDLAKKSPQSAVIDALASVQDDFFSFLSGVPNAVTPLGCRGNRSLWIYTDVIDDLHKIRFVCLNSALASRLEEDQGGLFLLNADLASIQTLPPCELTAILLHHPLNWLEATNSVQASSAIDSVADLVFSGHQHHDSAFHRESLEGSMSTFFEAAALDPTTTKSGFRVVVVDFGDLTFSETPFSWMGDAYLPTQPEQQSRPLRKNPTPRRTGFLFTDEHERYLNDPGVGFTHPRKEMLSLADIYVTPDLTSRQLRPVAGRLYDEHRIQSERTLDYLASKPLCLVIGEERAGKTALAKTLARLLRLRGLAPVMIPGESIRRKPPKELQRVIGHFVDIQYGSGAKDRFWQLKRSERSIIVDDFHKCNLNAAGQVAVVDCLKDRFDYVYIFADSVLRFGEVRHDDGSPPAFADFEHLEIREFGYFLRAHLIERWHYLGRERVLSEGDLVRETDRSERLVEALLGRSLLPSFPFAVLTILQTSEAGREASRDAGSFGSMYEALIAEALTSGSTPTDTNVNYAFLAAVAHRMFEENRRFLSTQEIEDVARHYSQLFAVNINIEKRLDDFRERRMLARAEASWEFRYPYIYYYFVARWFRDRVGKEPAARQQLLDMADRVYSERNSNILVFYLALTQDLAVVERVLQNADNIYASSSPCDFTLDVAFLDDLFKGKLAPIDLALPSKEAREAYRKQLDGEREADSGRAEIVDDEEDVRYNEQLADIAKLNISFKTLQILGQFVRNFPGSLEATLKKKLVESCYLLGLRTLGAILRIMQTNLAEARLYFRELVRDKRALLSEAEVSRAGDEATLALAKMCSFGIIKKVSNAVGLEELTQTYAAVLEDQSSIATRLIDTSIKLDHFSAPPESEIYDLAQAVKRNYFTTVVLRDLVKHHLMLFPVSQTMRQRLLSWLNMRGPIPEVFGSPGRRLR